MGGSAPQTPRDLALFFSRMDILGFSDLRSSRIMERLDRRIGQRRDATRAPIQARNGWRPSGRLLVSPLRHLRTGKILSKRWGPPHVAATKKRWAAVRAVKAQQEKAARKAARKKAAGKEPAV